MAEAQSLDNSQLPAFFRSKMFKPSLTTALILYFLYLVFSTIPARVAAWAVHEAVPQLWLTSVSGSVWNGRAGGSQVDVGRKTIPLGSVRWSLNPWSLLILSPCLSFEAESAGQVMSGEFCQSPMGSTSISDLNLEMPIQVIEDLLPELDSATGQLSIQVPAAEISGQRINQMDARFSWQNASISFEDVWYSLGSLGGQATQNGSGGAQAKLFDISGPYGFDIKAGWAPGNENWNIDAKVTPREGANSNVVNALQTIAEETTPGTYQIKWP